MKAISSLEVHYLALELQSLKGSKVDKVYQQGKEELLVQMHKPGEGKKIVRIIVGKTAFLAASKEDSESPGGFSMLLRKHLSGSILQSITQIKPERILHFTFQAKDKLFFLYAEFFGKGNVIFCDGRNVILDALTHHEFRGRVIRPKEEYTYPPSKCNFFDIDEIGLSILLKESTKDVLVTSLATDLCLGGLFAEELCALSGIGKSIILENITKEQLSALAEKLATLLHQEIKPAVYEKDGEASGVTPFPLTSILTPFKEFLTFSEALEYYCSHAVEKSTTSHDSQLEKLRAIIAQQEENISSFAKEEAESREKGEFIYTHYQSFSTLLSQVKGLLKTHKDWGEATKKFPFIKEANPKERAILVEPKEP